MGTEPQLTMTRRTASAMDVSRGRTRVSFEAVAHLAELADFNVAFALRAVCQLRMADHMGDDPRAVDAIAHATDCHTSWGIAVGR